MNNNFFKGVMTGAIMGAVVGIILDPMRSNSSHKQSGNMKRKAGRMFKTAGTIIENLTDM